MPSDRSTLATVLAAVVVVAALTSGIALQSAIAAPNDGAPGDAPASAPATLDDPTVSVEDATVSTGSTTTVEVRLSEVPDGLSGYTVTVSVAASSTATITGASIPDRFGLKDTDVSDGEVTISAADTGDEVGAGDADVLLGEITLRGESAGTTDLDVTVDRADDDDGGAIAPSTDAGTLTVEGSGEADFEVSNFDAPSTVTEGDSTTVSADVENTGSAAGTETVEYRLDGSVLASTDVTLDPGESTTVTFDVTADVSPGTYTHGIYAPGDSDTATITVEDAGGGGDGPTVTVGDATVSAGSTATVGVRLTAVPDGFSGYTVTVSVADSSTATIANASIPDRFGLKDADVSDGAVTLSAADTGGAVGPGDTDVDLGEITLRGESAGTTDLEVTVDRVDDEDGDPIDPATEAGSLTVEGGDDDDPFDRTLGRSSVAADGSLEVTLSAEFDEDKDAVSILDGFTGPVTGASIDAIRVGGSEVSARFSDASADGLTVAIEDVPADATVEVVYTVSIDGDPGDEVRFTGSEDNPDVSAGGTTAEFGTDVATVAESAVDRADANDDGSIDDAELRAAIVEWSAGSYTDAQLRSIVVAWSTS